jgi:hypothetical protein
MWNTERFEWVTPKELQVRTFESARALNDFADKLRVSSELQLSEQDKIWLRSIKVSA